MGLSRLTDEQLRQLQELVTIAGSLPSDIQTAQGCVADAFMCLLVI